MRSVIATCFLLSILCWSANAMAEEDPPLFYIAPFGGLSFAGEMSDLKGRRTTAGTTFSDLDLDNSAMFGLKLGFSPPPKVTWFSWELEAFYSSPHVKQQTVTATTSGGSVSGEAAGSRMRHLVTAFNFVLRYPHGPVQPYVGVGPSIVWVRSSNPDTGTVSDSSWGLNLLAGTRIMMNDRIGGFIEFKHNRSSFIFPALKGDVNLSAAVVGLVLGF